MRFVLEHGRMFDSVDNLLDTMLKIYNNHIKNCEINIKNINDDLSNFGVDSLAYLKIIVDIENTFFIEFDDEKLIFSELPTVSAMVEYVESKM